MKNISVRHSGAPNGSWRSLATITAAAFATRPIISRSIIDLTAYRSARRASTISPRFALNATTSRQPLSAADVTRPSQSRAPILQNDPSLEPLPETGYRSLTLRIVGAAPLVMHSGALANPLSPASKELKKITKKRPKTDADIEYMSRVEWTGGLWLSHGHPCIPGEAIEAAFVQAARKSRRGAIAKAGMISPGDWPIEYDGPRDLAALWEDESFRLVAGVRVGQARIMRTRPIFHRWAATVTFEYLDDQLDESDVIDLLRIAGRLIGVGDWRPRYGRFEVQR
jgi:hypothetical protein